MWIMLRFGGKLQAHFVLLGASFSRSPWKQCAPLLGGYTSPLKVMFAVTRKLPICPLPLLSILWEDTWSLWNTQFPIILLTYFTKLWKFSPETIMTVVAAKWWFFSNPIHVVATILLCGNAFLSPFISLACFILWVVIHYYHFLFWCSKCTSLWYWEPLHAGSVSFCHIPIILWVTSLFSVTTGSSGEKIFLSLTHLISAISPMFQVPVVEE